MRRLFFLILIPLAGCATIPYGIQERPHAEDAEVIRINESIFGSFMKIVGPAAESQFRSQLLRMKDPSTSTREQATREFAAGMAQAGKAIATAFKKVSVHEQRREAKDWMESAFELPIARELSDETKRQARLLLRDEFPVPTKDEVILSLLEAKHREGAECGSNQSAIVDEKGIEAAIQTFLIRVDKKTKEPVPDVSTLWVMLSPDIDELETELEKAGSVLIWKTDEIEARLSHLGTSKELEAARFMLRGRTLGEVYEIATYARFYDLEPYKFNDRSPSSKCPF